MKIHRLFLRLLSSPTDRKRGYPPFPILAALLAFGVMADPYPPYYGGGAGPAVHYAPVAWPDEVDWIAYTFLNTDQKDNAIQDPSNGGTSPQNYVNITSGCTDVTEPSIYYAYDAVNEVLFFRWRVQQPANTYATGPSPGSFGPTDPWNSALWTVLIDIDGDGYREYTIMLDGFSGEPAAAVDRMRAYYSDTPLQYPDTPELGHNPAGFVDGNAATTTNTILNFQGSLPPTTSWPNGSEETDWDYGTTRFQLISGTTCDEHWATYQIPLGLMDASSQGGPTFTKIRLLRCSLPPPTVCRTRCRRTSCIRATLSFENRTGALWRYDHPDHRNGAAAAGS